MFFAKAIESSSYKIELSVSLFEGDFQVGFVVYE
jgi:hypothetical protein